MTQQQRDTASGWRGRVGAGGLALLLGTAAQAAEPPSGGAEILAPTTGDTTAAPVARDPIAQPGAQARYAALSAPAALSAASPRAARADPEEPAAEPCASQPNDIEEAIVRADAAFARLDTAGFRAAQDEVLAELRCLQSVITPRLSAEVHRVVAMRAFVELQEELIIPSLHAMLLLQPGYYFGEELVPGEGHGLNLALEEARKRPQGTPSLLVPYKNTSYRMDGERAVERFSNLPAVVQVLSVEGLVLWSGYVHPTDPLPPPDMRPPPLTAREKTTRGLLIGAGVSATVGLGSAVAMLAMQQRTEGLAAELAASPWPAVQEDHPALVRSYNATNLLGYTAQGAAVGAALLGSAGLVLTLRW